MPIAIAAKTDPALMNWNRFVAIPQVKLQVAMLCPLVFVVAVKDWQSEEELYLIAQRELAANVHCRDLVLCRVRLLRSVV